VSPAVAIARTELRILRHDPVPIVLLIVMPIVLMCLLSESIGHLLALEGYEDAPGSMQTTPGMACLFGAFSIAIVGFAIFREHGWRTWPRLRAAGVRDAPLLAGKLAVPAGLLALQHLVLFSFAVLVLDFRVDGSEVAVGLLAFGFACMVLCGGLAAAALLHTVQQLNAVTNLGTMVLGGLGGAVVPVAQLPDAVQAIAPLSPVGWAMDGYTDVIIRGEGVSAALAPVAGMMALAVALLGVAAWRLRSGALKRTWG
jgi:ABC-2 type transport system permease protein